jgi:uncharacterized membrane protein YozB (DUF420 family)
MLLGFLSGPIVLHAGTPAVVSQSSLTIMLVVLGIVMIGIGFGRLAKNRENLLLHRWSLSVGIALSCVAIFFVMLPAAFSYYVNPDVAFFSSLSITTIVHAALGFPAIVMGLIYAFGDLPENVKKWMRWTALFWVVGTASGVFLFFLMMGLI